MVNIFFYYISKREGKKTGEMFWSLWWDGIVIRVAQTWRPTEVRQNHWCQLTMIMKCEKLNETLRVAPKSIGNKANGKRQQRLQQQQLAAPAQVVAAAAAAMEMAIEKWINETLISTHCRLTVCVVWHKSNQIHLYACNQQPAHSLSLAFDSYANMVLVLSLKMVVCSALLLKMDDNIFACTLSDSLSCLLFGLVQTQCM